MDDRTDVSDRRSCGFDSPRLHRLTGASARVYRDPVEVGRCFFGGPFVDRPLPLSDRSGRVGVVYRAGALRSPSQEHANPLHGAPTGLGGCAPRARPQLKAQPAQAVMHVVVRLPGDTGDQWMSRHLLEHDIVTIPLSRCSLRPLEYDALLLGFTGWSAGETTSTVERLARIVEPPSSTPRARSRRSYSRWRRGDTSVRQASS